MQIMKKKGFNDSRGGNLLQSIEFKLLSPTYLIAKIFQKQW